MRCAGLLGTRLPCAVVPPLPVFNSGAGIDQPPLMTPSLPFSRAHFSPSRRLNIRPAALALLLLASVTVALAQLKTNLSYERILNSANEPGNWLTYGGNYASQRYSLLTEITPANVA